jgi:RecJ-like exonuclease
MKIHTCPRCHGSGKMPYTIDEGVCYKCNGAGVVGGSDSEQESFIAKKISNNQKSIIVKSIRKQLNAVYGFEYIHMDILKGKISKSVYHYSVNLDAANAFNTPYVCDYSELSNVTNPSAETLNTVKVLQGHSVVISKVNYSKIKLEFL